MVRPQDGKGDGRSYPLKGAGFYERPVWSPDSGKIAFIDNARALYWIDLGTSAVKRIAAEPIYSPINTLSSAWSPDSKWLAYTLTNRAGFQTIRLYALGPDQSHPLTDGLIEAGEPVFDASGKYLYFLASTDSGPVKNWFDQSNTDMQASCSVYLVTLAKATPNPLLKESDEETAAEATKDKDSKDKKTQDSKTRSEKASKDREKGEDKDKDKDQAESHTARDKPAVVIDLEGIAGRVVPLPIEAGHLEGLAAGNEGQVYYIRRAGGVPGRGHAGRGKPSLKRFDLKTREEETLADGIESFSLSTDRKKILYQVGAPGGGGPPGGAAEGPVVLGIVDAGKFTKGDGALRLEAVSVPVEPRAEWAQIFREAWRINRDYFYATTMHGADWNAVRTKYEELLPHLASRGDLNRVIRMMLSELSVGHSFLSGGERLYEPKPIPVGLLGADYEVVDGRYRFKTIYGGAYWDPSLRAALRAGSRHQAG